MRLLAEARAEYEGPVGVQYFDTTFSVDKTISLAHASALASAMDARQAGDLRLAEQREARAARIWAETEHSVRLYVTHMQREANASSRLPVAPSEARCIRRARPL